MTSPDWVWNHDTPIVGCKEIGYENATSESRKGQNWDLANCTTGAGFLGAFGIAPNVFDIPDNNDLKLFLTLGRPAGSSRLGGANPDPAVFKHHFYIGKPAGFDLRRPGPVTAGCALIWQDQFRTFDIIGGSDAFNGGTSSCGRRGNGETEYYRRVLGVFHDFRTGYRAESNQLPLCEALAKNIYETFRHSSNYLGTSDRLTGPLQEGIDGITPVMSVIYKDNNTTTIQSAYFQV
ncbi:hypothetical protein OQA88_12461 [Cercophora sp. LCS_1]